LLVNFKYLVLKHIVELWGLRNTFFQICNMWQYLSIIANLCFIIYYKFATLIFIQAAVMSCEYVKLIFYQLYHSLIIIIFLKIYIKDKFWFDQINVHAFFQTKVSSSIFVQWKQGSDSVIGQKLISGILNICKLLPSDIFCPKDK